MSKSPSNMEVLKFLRKYNVFNLEVSLNTVENYKYQLQCLSPPNPEFPFGDRKYHELGGVGELLHYELKGLVCRPNEFLGCAINVEVDCDERRGININKKSNLGDGHIQNIDELGCNNLNFCLRLNLINTRYGENILHKLGVWQKINQPYCDILELDSRGIPITVSLEFLEFAEWRTTQRKAEKRIGFYINRFII
jgi:hypothetical protein